MGYGGGYGYYGGYYGQAGIPGQPGQHGGADAGGQNGTWDPAAAQAYYQSAGWGDYYSEFHLLWPTQTADRQTNSRGRRLIRFWIINMSRPVWRDGVSSDACIQLFYVFDLP